MLFKLGATAIITTILLVKSIECQSHPNQPYHYDVEANLSLCNFFDTINITGGIENSDKSIMFEGVRYTKEDYGIFNYTYLPNQYKIPVPSHKRGCVCKYKNCVRLCCETGYSFYDVVNNENKNKHICAHNKQLDSILVKITHDGVQNEVDLLKHLNITIVSERPCRTGYFIDPIADPLDEWKLLSNGSLFVGVDLLQNHDEYCLAHAFNEITGGFDLKAMLCTTTDPEPEPKIIAALIYPAVMLVSVCFLSLTLFVYVWIEELRRTIHGKNLMCYLATLIVGYSFLAFTYIDNSHAHKGPLKCLIVAEVIHTSFICGFIWLSIISFDIWRTIGRTDNHRNQFFKYCLFACGITLVIVVITNLIDTVDFLPELYRPGLGKSTCWLQDSKFAHFLYLYSIIIIILTINTVLFILTKLKIEWVKRISDRATTSESSRKFSREETDADRFGLFLRLFIIMGIPWIIEIISWLLDIEHIIIYILDVVTMLQGPIIFFLFIKKRRVKKLIKRKLSTLSFRPNTSVRNSGSAGISSSGMTTVSTTMKLDEIKTGHE